MNVPNFLSWEDIKSRKGFCKELQGLAIINDVEKEINKNI